MLASKRVVGSKGNRISCYFFQFTQTGNVHELFLDRAVNTDTGATPVEAQNVENQLNSDESVKSRQQVPPENGKTHTREKKGPKNHVRNKNKPVKTNKQGNIVRP